MASVVKGAPILPFRITTLWGRLSQLEDGRTQVELRVKPPGELLIGLLIILLLAVIGLVKGIGEHSEVGILAILLLIAGASYFIAITSKVKVERMYDRYLLYIHKVLQVEHAAPNT